MPSTKNIKIGERIILLLVGKNGNGKTVQVASFAEAGPGKIFDFDGRMDSIKAVYPDLDIEYDTYGVREVKNPDGSSKIKSLDQFMKEFIDLTKSCPYKWICVDSITSLTTTCINYQMVIKGGENKTTKGGVQVPSWDEFNGEAMMVSRMLDIAKMLPCHVIFTAHPVQKMDINNQKITESIVSFGVKVPNLIPGYFNEIFFLEMEAPTDARQPQQRTLYTSASPGIFAKTTLPLPKKIVLPDSGPGIYSIIQAALRK